MHLSRVLSFHQEQCTFSLVVFCRDTCTITVLFLVFIVSAIVYYKRIINGLPIDSDKQPWRCNVALAICPYRIFINTTFRHGTIQALNTSRTVQRSVMDIEFHLIVPERSQELYDEWQRALNEHVPPNLRRQFHFVRSLLNDLPGTRFDAIVSPANSYGRMGAFTLQIVAKTFTYHTYLRWCI